MQHKIYQDEMSSQIGFPMGGIGAGMICLGGNGMLTSVSIDNRPQVYFEPNIFAAIHTKKTSRVLEGPIPWYKIFGNTQGAGNGLSGKNYGLTRFSNSSFKSYFPFADVELIDDKVPVKSSVTGWSPFIPCDADNSSLPVAALEYKFVNNSEEIQDMVFSYHVTNDILASSERGERRIYKQTKNGFIVENILPEESKGIRKWFSVTCEELELNIDNKWLRSGWWDPLTALWRNISEGNVISNVPYPENEDNGMGSSLYVPFKLNPGESKIIVIKLCWYVPNSQLKIGEIDKICDCPEGMCDNASEFYSPWYSSIFGCIDEVNNYFTKNYIFLRDESKKFSDTFYSMTIPDSIIEAVAANLSILKSPTVLRQNDGKLWAWEGCCDNNGCCHGSCTHVWNYAFALSSLFPSLERSLRETEFFISQNNEGHQTFRSNIPITPAIHNFHAASDGQLGGIMKAYREWKTYGDTMWLRKIFKRMCESIDYCIKTWDPDEIGVLIEPHHNTYDIEFWGPDGMCTSFYLGALRAMYLICDEIGYSGEKYKRIYEAGRKYCETELWNGEYFYQKVMLEGLHASSELALRGVPAETAEVIKKEGPRYQYGTGCISDGVIGCWMAKMCGLGDILDPEKVKSHLLCVYKYNFRKSLSEHSNPQRPAFAMRDEAGLLLCSWPHGSMPTLPFPYSNEVWTGIEYQVAAHLASYGFYKECTDIVEGARNRYDGYKRNPYNEIECGHWYARAMASYSLLCGMTGVRYDAVCKTLFVKEDIENFVVFISTDKGYGTVNKKGSEVKINIVSGIIEVSNIIMI